MLSQSDQLGNYVNVIKQLLNKAITDISIGMLRTQEFPFGMGGLLSFSKDFNKNIFDGEGKKPQTNLKSN